MSREKKPMPRTKRENGYRICETEKGLKLIITDSGLRQNLYHAGCSYSVPWHIAESPKGSVTYFDLEDVYGEVKANELFEMSHEDEDFSAFIEWLSKQGEVIDAKIKTQFEQGLISFTGIKALFKKGDIVVFNNDLGDLQAMRIETISDHAGWGGVYKKISGQCLTHNGRGFIMGTISFSIPMWSGAKPVKDLGMHMITEEERTILLARGEHYVDVMSNPNYMNCQGNLTRRGWISDQVYNANGRVMIDLTGMKQADSDYNTYMGCPRWCNEDDAETLTLLSDEVKTLAVSAVYGFSFRSKKWGEISLKDLSAIVFRSDAFDRLVLNRDTKDLLFALVDSSDLARGQDFVDNKGGGLIFLLHGTPGVGKTFTAEAISERLQRPLYMVSVGEIGTEAVEVERRLKDILETAQRWNAILLLDECDIFLEKRKEDDMERNAVVSVFLRMIEYYQGILFMTTNRVNELDPAFYSRISLPIHYDPLGREGRVSIWHDHLLGHGTQENLAGELALEMAEYPLNGREIKSCIRLGCALAGREGRALIKEDLIRVVKYLQSFGAQAQHAYV